jgi:hypothetical protein
MRKESPILKKPSSAPSRARVPASRRVVDSRRAKPDESADWALTAAQTREIKRRVADLDDPIRYLLVSRMGPRFALYYNVSDDLYAMNDPTGATLFKRRKAAECVKRTLGRGVDILQCRTRTRKGVRLPVAASIERRAGKRQKKQ